MKVFDLLEISQSRNGKKVKLRPEHIGTNLDVSEYPPKNQQKLADFLSLCGIYFRRSQRVTVSVDENNTSEPGVSVAVDGGKNSSFLNKLENLQQTHAHPFSLRNEMILKMEQAQKSALKMDTDLAVFAGLFDFSQ